MDVTAATVPIPGKHVTKAVIPAHAGLGTPEFLPATKATPKEMLPVVDKPSHPVRRGGSRSRPVWTTCCMITGRSKRSIEDHFDRAYELEEALAAKEDTERLAQVRESSDLATVHYVRQGDPKGLGHAVLCAAQHVGDEPFAVLLGDDLIDARDHLLTRMIEVQQQHGGSVVALMEVDPEQVSQYGSAAISPTAEEDNVVTVTDLVEKPVPRLGAEQPGDHRSLRAGSGRVRRAAPHPARPGRGDPADRRAADAGQDEPGRRAAGVHGGAVSRASLRHR